MDGEGVRAGIDFIYQMREHIVDVAVTTLFFLTVYATVLWIKKKLG